MTRVIEPTQGRVLVKLGVSEYGNVPVPPKDYDSITYGVILKVHPNDEKEYGFLIGRTGHWKKFMDDLRIEGLVGEEKLALIPIDKIDGTSYDE